MADPLARSTSAPLLPGLPGAASHLPPAPPQSQQPQQPQHLQPRQVALYPIALPLPAPLDHMHTCCAPHMPHMHPQQVYVLAPDGSGLYLVDASAPPKNEEPPPYAPFRPVEGVENGRSGSRSGGGREAGASAGAGAGGVMGDDSGSGVRPTNPRGPRSPRSRVRAATTGGMRYPQPALADESTPLLPHRGPRWRWAELVRGWKGEGYFAPIRDAGHWAALAHLALLNFPFNLLVWPPLLVGTLVGTVLLITLPLGAFVWWLTLVLSRWAAGRERAMQARFHGAEFGPLRPVFRSTWDAEAARERPEGFWRCSWAMFCNYYSYASLSYFLLVKPLVILLSTIAVVALLPLALVLFPLLPVYLRCVRAWGWCQARVAMQNI